MLYIKKNSAPVELAQYYDSDLLFPDLQNPDKNSIKNQLLQEQGGLCAYCMKKINMDNSSIEHWYPRNPKSGEKKEKVDFDYYNLYVTCRENNKRLINQTCDEHKGNSIITINPSVVEHIDTIYYNSNGEIHSTNPDFEKDIDDILNLNCEYSNLNTSRKKVMIEIEKQIMENCSTKEEIVDFCRKKLLIDYTSDKPAYLGVLLYWLKRYIQKYSQI